MSHPMGMPDPPPLGQIIDWCINKILAKHSGSCSHPTPFKGCHVHGFIHVNIFKFDMQTQPDAKTLVFQPVSGNNTI